MSEDTRPDSHLYNFTSEKAGMQGIDRAEINRVIHEASKDSDFYKHQVARDAQIQERIASMQVEIEQFLAQGEAHVRRFREKVDAVMAEIEGKRVMTETWIHVDMDMFYAAVEIRDNPELKGLPVAVGGKGMIGTASYEARKFGVRSAMPGFIGEKLCPNLVFVKPNFDKYKAVGKQIRSIFRLYDPEFESMGLDEAHLHVTPYLNSRGLNTDEGRQELAKEIRGKIFEMTQLTASAGIACNKMLAKIGSDVNKPNGQFYLPPDKDQILSFISSQNVRKIPGIGKVSEKILNELGISTCSQIIQERVKLFAVFSQSSFEFFLSSALGIGSIHHPVEVEDQKSISISRTFRATDDIQALEDMLKRFCSEVIEELQRKNGSFKTITVFYKTAKFERKEWMTREEDLFTTAVKILREWYPLEPLRLLGVRISGLNFRVSKEQMFMEKYLAGGEESKGGDVMRERRLEPEPGQVVGDTLEPPPESVPPTPTAPHLSSQPSPPLNGIRMLRLQCPLCSKWLTTTDYLLSIHMKDCGRKAVTAKKQKKRGASLSLDAFTYRKQS